MTEAVTPLPQEQPPTGFLGLMRNRNYALLWWGQLISEFGNRFHWIAVSLWVFAKTGSASAVSIAVSSTFVGSLLVSLWAGVLVDRFSRKRIMVIADMSRAVLVALIPVLMEMNLRLVYVDLALISVATAFFRPAILAAVPQVVDRRDLLGANSFFAAMDTSTEIAGPAIAGLLAFTYGYSLLLYVDAVTYAVSAALIIRMAIAPLVNQAREKFRLRGILAEAIDGLRYVRRDQLQWGLFMLIFPAYLVGSGLNALQTPLAKGLIGITDAEFGVFNSVWGVGFVVASLLLGWYGSLVRRSWVILGGYFLGFAGTALMARAMSFQGLLVTGFMVGFANTFYYVGLTTVIMERTPGGVIGRVVSTRQLALSLVRVVAPLVFGGIAEVIGVRQAIIVLASVGTIGTLAVIFANPTVRRFDAQSVRLDWKLEGVLRVLGGPTDPEYEPTHQQRLNLLSVGLILVVWLRLLYSFGYPALLLLVAVLLLAVLGSVARRRGLLPPSGS